MPSSPRNVAESRTVCPVYIMEIPEKQISRTPKNANAERRFIDFRKNIRNYFTEYSRNTSIHGLKYIGERERSIFEKLCWLTTFVISLYVCTCLILNTWNKWEENPVLISFNKNPARVWEIPFPAVTVCPENKIRQRLYNFTHYFRKQISHDNLTAEEFKNFSDTSLICNHFFCLPEPTIDAERIKHLMNLAPPLQEVLEMCLFNSEPIHCKKAFAPTMTNDGLCFTFNILDKSELFTDAAHIEDDHMDHEKASKGWSLDNDYFKTTKNETIPKRTDSVGPQSGLFLYLKTSEEDLDYICRFTLYGYKILLHHPAEFPKLDTHYFLAPFGKDIEISIKADVVTTSSDLRHYDPNRRKCFYSDEHPLKFFRVYTQQNCQIECITNYTLSECQCVAYHMPREQSTKICGPANLQCLQKAEKKLMTLIMEYEIQRYNTKNFNKSPIDCNCLPSCNSIAYNAEMFKTDLIWDKIVKASGLNFFENKRHFTVISIFFKDMKFAAKERTELFGQTDFWASCGGLLGLFIGFSLLSLVEIVYFFTLRLICNVQKFGRCLWAGSDKK